MRTPSTPRRGYGSHREGALHPALSSRWHEPPRAVATVPEPSAADGLLGDPDPAHPQDHDGPHARAARAPRAGRGAEGRRSLRVEAQLPPRATGRGAGQGTAYLSGGTRRTENAVATIQGRSQIQDIELAAGENGRLTAVRVRLLCDMGAYLQLVTPSIPLLGAFLYAGVYDLPAAYDFSCTSVFTNMTPTDAYRGSLGA